MSHFFEISLASTDSDAESLLIIIIQSVPRFVVLPLLKSFGAQGHRQHLICFTVPKGASLTPGQIRTWSNSLCMRQPVIIVLD